MSYASDLSQSQEYLSFRSSIPLKKVVVDADASKGWKLYDSGPKRVKVPLVCLPPVSGTADVFFKLMLPLSARGFRVIAAEHPVYWNVKEWCEGFRKLLDYLDLQKVHIFGASLGGFLAQKFSESTSNCPRVASLILCNTFTDTSVFSYSDSAAIFWMLPSLVLKKMVMGNFTAFQVDSRIADSIDFMVERMTFYIRVDIQGFYATESKDFIAKEIVIVSEEEVLCHLLIQPPVEVKADCGTRYYLENFFHGLNYSKGFVPYYIMIKKLESLSQQELASRLTMNCVSAYVEPQKLSGIPITVLDVFDEYALSNAVREEMYKCYPTAKLAHLKSGGNFPYLSRSDEVNLHVQIHLRAFEGTCLCASESGKEDHAG